MDAIDRWNNKSLLQGKPLQASIELTNRCNERCTHCYIDSFKDDPDRVLDQEEWFHILKELRSGGVLYLILMGGEAMLSPHFWPVLKKASQMGFHTSLITNGLKIKNQATADQLADSGLKLATFSLYSLDSKIHDHMTRVPHSHKRIMDAILFCELAGIRPTINCLLTKNNIEGAFDMYKWAAEKDYLLKIDVNVTPKFSGDMEPTRQRASREQLKWYFSEMKKRFGTTSPPSEEKTTDYVCNAAKGKCAVTAYGELLPCVEIREPMGNLLDKTFMSLWAGKAAAKWRNIKVGELKDVQDGELELQNFCEHCPGLSDHEHGDAKKMTEFTRTIGEIKRELWKE